MTKKIISWAFYILFFFTPLFFTPFNNELFEYNKMMLVYGLTVIIVGSWLLRMLQGRTIILKHTPLDIPLLLFYISQVLSTIFSMDIHTSIWGYYSRSNGGLLSITSYILLYFAFVSNFEAGDIPRFLKSSLLGGFLVSLYAIPEHFGISPSCIILTGQATAGCWVQDVQARVFATLGQPNWLAAYLGMLIFPALYFFLTVTRKAQKLFFYSLLLIFYLAFTFTYSRGATLGLLAGLAIFVIGFICFRFKQTKNNNLIKKSITILKSAEIKQFGIILISFILINFIFGSALTRFKFITPASIAPKTTSTAAPSGVTQLENGGSESGNIRLIVWKGAIEIFKHYPIFGSGLETFAYSYYNFRPFEHNTVSEWDFLYNKAHNEYLNYLATTGIVGFVSYILIILVFIFWCISRIFNLTCRQIGFKFSILKISDVKINLDSKLLTLTILASYFSYLVQNFFGFSVVVIAVFFYLFPALAFVTTNSTKQFKFPKQLNSISYIFTSFIYRRKIYTKILRIFLILMILSYLFNLTKLWIADTYYKKGSDSEELGNPGKAYNDLSTAAGLNPGEPLYHSDLGFAAASSSVAIFPDDATTSARLKDEAVYETDLSLHISPRNVSLWRTAIRTYYQLSNIDPKFVDKTVEALDRSIVLAPTDAKLYYNKGLVLSQSGKDEEGIAALEKAGQLKSNYWEAYFALGEIYQQKNEKEKAKTEYEKVIQILPNEPETLRKLEELKK